VGGFREPWITRVGVGGGSRLPQGIDEFVMPKLLGVTDTTTACHGPECVKIVVLIRAGHALRVPESLARQTSLVTVVEATRAASKSVQALVGSPACLRDRRLLHLPVRQEALPLRVEPPADVLPPQILHEVIMGGDVAAAALLWTALYVAVVVRPPVVAEVLAHAVPEAQQVESIGCREILVQVCGAPDCGPAWSTL